MWQVIAESWPRAVDARAARADWGFAPKFDLAGMTQDMLAQLTARRNAVKRG